MDQAPTHIHWRAIAMGSPDFLICRMGITACHATERAVLETKINCIWGIIQLRDWPKTNSLQIVYFSCYGLASNSSIFRLNRERTYCMLLPGLCCIYQNRSIDYLPLSFLSQQKQVQEPLGKFTMIKPVSDRTGSVAGGGWKEDMPQICSIPLGLKSIIQNLASLSFLRQS